MEEQKKKNFLSLTGKKIKTIQSNGAETGNEETWKGVRLWPLTEGRNKQTQKPNRNTATPKKGRSRRRFKV